MYPKSKKRRLGERYPVCLDVELHLKGARRPASTVDVSRHGLFVELSDPPHEARAVFLTVHAPTGTFETMAIVAHRQREGGERPEGAGLKFFCMAGEAAERWNRFVSSLEKVQGQEPTTLPPPRQDDRPGEARFFIQLDGVAEMYRFFNHHVASGNIVKVAPPLRQVGACVDIVFVHPQSQDEFVLQATVEELYEDDPLRMGIRFEPIAPESRRAFMTFIGPSSAATDQNLRDSPPLLAEPRRGWTEYAFFSPRVRTEAPAEPAAVKQLVPSEASQRTLEQEQVDLEHLELDAQQRAELQGRGLEGLEELESPATELAEEQPLVVEGELLELPELELVDPHELFDFDWKGPS